MLCENETTDRDIVSLVTKNKLCSKKPYVDTECPNHEGTCDAKLTIDSPIGNETAMAKEAIGNLLNLKEKIHVREFTTDLDSKAYKGGEELYKKKSSPIKAEHFLDVRHLSSGQRKHIRKTKFSKNFFPGKNAKEKASSKSYFSNELAKRCQMEVELAMKCHAGDIKLVTKSVSSAIPIIGKCYSGNHTECRRRTMTCDGSQKRNWLAKSQHLPDDFRLTFARNDFEKFLDCLLYRLKADILKKARRNRNTQKVESTNRVIRKALPARITFKKSFPGRAHAAIYAVNNGPENSVLKLAKKLNMSVLKGSRVEKGLESLQHSAALQ